MHQPDLTLLIAPSRCSAHRLWDGKSSSPAGHSPQCCATGLL